MVLLHCFLVFHNRNTHKNDHLKNHDKIFSFLGELSWVMKWGGFDGRMMPLWKIRTVIFHELTERERDLKSLWVYVRIMEYNKNNIFFGGTLSSAPGGCKFLSSYYVPMMIRDKVGFQRNSFPHMTSGQRAWCP